MLSGAFGARKLTAGRPLHLHDALLQKVCGERHSIIGCRLHGKRAKYECFRTSLNRQQSLARNVTKQLSKQRRVCAADCWGVRSLARIQSEIDKHPDPVDAVQWDLKACLPLPLVHATPLAWCVGLDLSEPPQSHARRLVIRLQLKGLQSKEVLVVNKRGAAMKSFRPTTAQISITLHWLGSKNKAAPS